MRQFFKELFEYNHHFNLKLLKILNDNPDKTSEKSIKLYNHILNAHQIWNNRIDPVHVQYEVWEIHLRQDLEGIEKQNLEHTLFILDSFDLNEKINFTNKKGMVFNNCIRDVFFHVINHYTYHKGQIATEFRKNGIEPLKMDYILYKS